METKIQPTSFYKQLTKYGLECSQIRERPLMMSDFRGDGMSEITPKNWTLEGKNWTLGGDGVSKIIRHH